MSSFLLFLLMLGLFLFPIAIYCTILGMINRRPQPLAVSGSWDFVGLLLATSGFLLFVGPYLLSGGFRQGLRDLPLQSVSESLGSALGEIWALWWLVWLMYYLAVIAGAALLVWSRRDITVVYNIAADTLEQALHRAAQRLGWDMARRGDRVYLSPHRSPTNAVETDLSERIPTAHPADGHQPQAEVGPLILELENFALLSNATIHWRGDRSTARVDFERQLHKALEEITILDNPAAGWLLGIGSLLFLLIMVVTAVVAMTAGALARR